MLEMPVWLPQMVTVDGEWRTVLSNLYEIFTNDFKNQACRCQDYIVWWDRRVLEGETYEEGFWHLISRGFGGSEGRLFDTRRAERISWCKPTLVNTEHNAVLIWNYREANYRIRTYAWLAEWDYVIILEKRKQRKGDIFFLITAYHVDGASRRMKLRKKYEQRIS